MATGKIIFWIAVIAADLLMFFFLGILLMGYDDNYDSTKGEYFSFSSMNTNEKLVYLIYNLFIITNVIAIGFLLYKFYKTYSLKKGE